MLDKSFEQLTEIAYKEMDISPSVFTKKGKAMDIFSLLKIKPMYDENNNRILTPYEVLGVPPQFNKAGKEVPIVFAIKNPIFKVAKLKEDSFHFVFKGEKEKTEDSIVDTLRFNYKKALFVGNEAEAEMYLKLLDEATGGKAKEVLGNFFNYTKFYKKMKKQLLMDIFAHFFLLYINKKTMVKNGITKKGKLFKAYKLKSQTMDSDVYEFDGQAMNDIGIQNPELSVIQSIKVTRPAVEDYEEVEVAEVAAQTETIKPKVEKNQKAEQDSQVNDVEPERKGLIEGFLSRINKKRANRKMRLRAHHLFAPTQNNYTEEDERQILEVEEKVKKQEEKQKNKEEYKVLA